MRKISLALRRSRLLALRNEVGREMLARYLRRSRMLVLRNQVGLIALTLTLTLLFAPAKAQKFDSLALTPPMGWNSWNCFHCDIDEQKIREIADAMVESGMREAGYEYLVIDDCWQRGRDAAGRIQADEKRFPSGIPALVDYVHSKGLKFGIYSCAGGKTCQGRPGSRDHEVIDAQTYAEWGVDFLKYDWCFHGNLDPQEAYTRMRDALYAAGRPVLFSICEWGKSQPWTWAADVGHMWRTTRDIVDCWDCREYFVNLGWTRILDMQDGLEGYSGPGHWNDPDMLQVGNGGMSYEEYKAHFALWCMLPAPLFAGNDLRTMSPEIRDLLTNPRLIAIDQDPLGKPARKIWDGEDFDVFIKVLQDGLAMCAFNRGNEPVKWAPAGDETLPSPEAYEEIREAWSGEVIADPYAEVEIPPHAAFILTYRVPRKR